MIRKRQIHGCFTCVCLFCYYTHPEVLTYSTHWTAFNCIFINVLIISRVFGPFVLLHFFLFDFFINYMALGKFIFYIVKAYAHMRHQNHNVISKVGNLKYSFFLIAAFARNYNLD